MDCNSPCKSLPPPHTHTHTHTQDNIQRILLSLAVRIQSTHRSFEKRRYLLAYHLFVKLVCQELSSDLDNTRSFIVMDIIHTIVRILSGKEKGKAGSVRELFALGCDTLGILCRATLQSCPEELSRHLHSVVAVLTSFAQNTHTPAGKQVRLHRGVYCIYHYCQCVSLGDYPTGNDSANLPCGHGTPGTCSLSWSLSQWRTFHSALQEADSTKTGSGWGYTCWWDQSFLVRWAEVSTFHAF